MAVIGGSGKLYATPTLNTPTNLAATATATQINLSWVDVSTRNTGYIIYRSLDGVTYSEIATIGNVQTYVDTGLTPATTYHYKVVAYEPVMYLIPQKSAKRRRLLAHA